MILQGRRLGDRGSLCEDPDTYQRVFEKFDCALQNWLRNVGRMTSEIGFSPEASPGNFRDNREDLRATKRTIGNSNAPLPGKHDPGFDFREVTDRHGEASVFPPAAVPT